MKVLIIGAGAREHVISEAYEKSNKVDSIVVSPGNDFIAWNRKKQVIIDKNCDLKNSESILAIAKKYMPDLIDVAQDDALASGATDLLRKEGFLVFGPSKTAARIEWDKKWSREFMLRNNIPAPSYNSFSSKQEATDFVRKIYSDNEKKLIYVKAAGLCSGKGAIKAGNLQQAINAIESMQGFGKSGEIFLIEEGLIGEEFSLYAISDGKNFKILGVAQDNKTILNFDNGDQTGGVGAISPISIYSKVCNQVNETQISNAISGMLNECNPYSGILYLGGIVYNKKSSTIEYNARWGDPESQVVLPGIKNDYYDLVMACIENRLNEVNLIRDEKCRVCLVGCSRGYPGDYSFVKGKRIFGIEDALKQGVKIYGAGIEVKEGKFYANGGRLFSLVAEGKNILEARQKAYEAMSKIHIEGNNLYFRIDIGWREVERFWNTKDKRAGVGVGVMLLKDNKVLLGLRNPNPEIASSALNGEGTWTFPGGKLKFGESFEEAGKRETKEECDMDVNYLNVICLNNDYVDGVHFVTIGLFSDDFSGTEKVMEENITEWGWFDLDNLPKPLYFPTAEMIENYKQGKFYIEKI